MFSSTRDPGWNRPPFTDASLYLVDGRANRKPSGPIELRLLGWARSHSNKRRWVSLLTKVDQRLSHIGNVRSAISTTLCLYFGLRRPLPQPPFHR